VRINEAFGDTVNWDLIPETAINRLDVVSNNPAFGLNALGGAISIEMKNGFTYEGRDGEVRGGSFGRRAATAQAGMRQGNVSAYVAADALNDNGWRDPLALRTAPRLRRCRIARRAIRVSPQFHRRVELVRRDGLDPDRAPEPELERGLHHAANLPKSTRFPQRHRQHRSRRGPSRSRAMPTSAASARPTSTATRLMSSPATPAASPGFLCFGNDAALLFGSNGSPVPDILGGAIPGTIDRTSTAASTYGGSAQAATTGKLFGHDNQFVIGAALDRGNVNFNASSELGTIGSDLFVTGTGVIISQPAGDVALVALKTVNTYTGLYLTDTFDVTSRLAVTAGGRFNVAQIRLDDQLGTALNGSHQFTRFNPVVGTTYKINRNVTAYGGYSEANRAPTPSELACADPTRPCLLDNFLVADPALQQVVAHTSEAGVRGEFDLGARNGRLAWSIGLFRTVNNNDIISVASAITGRGFFQNAGTTRRQGLEASASYRSGQWNVFATYSLVDATFRDNAHAVGAAQSFRHERADHGHARRPHSVDPASSFQGGGRICRPPTTGRWAPISSPRAGNICAGTNPTSTRCFRDTGWSICIRAIGSRSRWKLSGSFRTCSTGATPRSAPSSIRRRCRFSA